MKKRRVCDRQLWLLAALSLAVFVLTFAVGRYAVRVDKTVCILLDGALRKLSRGAWGLAQFWTDTEATIVLNVRLPRILAAALVGAALGMVLRWKVKPLAKLAGKLGETVG